MDNSISISTVAPQQTCTSNDARAQHIPCCEMKDFTRVEAGTALEDPDPEVGEHGSDGLFRTTTETPSGRVSTVSSPNGFYSRTFYPLNHESGRPQPAVDEVFSLQNLQDLTRYEYDARALYQTQSRVNRQFSAASRTTSSCNTAPFLSRQQLDKIAPPVLLIEEVRSAEETSESVSTSMSTTSDSAKMRAFGRRLVHSAVACAQGVGVKIVPGKRGRAMRMKRQVIEENERGEVCVICLEPWAVAGVATRTLTCNHTFHAECIETWCARSARCPIDNLELGKWRDY